MISQRYANRLSIITLLGMYMFACVNADNFAEDTLKIKPYRLDSYPGTPENHYLRVGVKSSDVKAACSHADKGKNDQTYIPVQLPNSRRMIKPHSMDSCKEQYRSLLGDLKADFKFKLLDSAQTGQVICHKDEKHCGVFLYDGSTPGFLKELRRNRSSSYAGRDLKYEIERCFPADATVTLPSGSTKRMSELKIGDKVLAARSDGTTFFDDIYMFGHKDTTARASFVKLNTASGQTLRLTPDHFVPVVRSGKLETIASAQVKVGDLVRVAAGNNGVADLEAVVKTSIIQDTGLFNPYTLNGIIVVDGVVASSHSSSALDAVFKAMHVSIPVGYQALFAPVRMLYRAVGPQAMRHLEPIIDSVAAVMNGETSVIPSTALVVAGATTVALLASRKRVLL